jgi:putative transcriptional regulator
MARKTLADMMATPAAVDHVRLDATTEEDIRRHMIEDGEQPDAEPGDFVLDPSPARVRAQLGMTQAEFAAALTIPVATLRNWEQGRVTMDPAARALLRIVAQAPEAALAALRPSPAAE